MDEVLSKRQGCQGVGSRAAAHSKTIAFALAGVGVLFFLFVLCYTTWMLSLRKNLQTANETSDELLANNGTGPFTVSNTSEVDGVYLSPKISTVQTTYGLNETFHLTTPRSPGGRKTSGRTKIRKHYRKQIHQLLSKLLGNGRTGNDENDRPEARNGTDQNPKKKSGRPKYRVRLPGRRKKKNRNTHRKTSPQRSGAASRGEKRRDRLKINSPPDRKGRTKLFDCKRKGECSRDKTQNETDVKRGNISTSPGTRKQQMGIGGNRNQQVGTVAGQSSRLEMEVKRRNITTQSRLVEGNKRPTFNVSTQSINTDRRGRVNESSTQSSSRVELGDDLKQTANVKISPSSRPPRSRCSDESSLRNHSQKESANTGRHGNNSSRSEPCSVTMCNTNHDGKLKRTRPESEVDNEENGDGDEAKVDMGNDEENNGEADDEDYEYDDEAGWKSNMEIIFAEFDRERSDEHLDTLRHVRGNQSQESDTCDLWIRCKYNSLQHYLKQLDELPGCPCIYPNLVWNNQLWDDSKESYFSWETANSPVDRSDIYKPGAKFCIRSLLEPGMVTLAAQHCCYDNNQQLITRGKAAGTPNLISPQISWELHRKVDILPWIICKGDWYRYHKVVPPNNAEMCKRNPEDTEFYRQVLDLKNI